MIKSRLTMNRKIKLILVLCSITNVLFTLAAIVSMFYGIAYTVTNSDQTSILPTIYSFFHALIAGFSAFFAIRSLKKGSVVMRTLMYVGDYQEITPSTVAKILTSIFGVFFLFVGIYFGLSFLIDAKLWLWSFPFVLRLVLVNVGFFIFVNMVYFFLFPFLYDIDKEIKEGKGRKHQIYA